jgi:hypothetical protein
MSRFPEHAEEPKRLLAETRAFLIRPIDETHRERRLAAVLRADPAQNLDTREHVEAAVEPAAIWHRVHVPADKQRALGFAAQRRPRVSRLHRCEPLPESHSVSPAARHALSPMSA